MVRSFRDLSDIVGSDLNKYAASYAALEASNAGSTELTLALAIVQLKLGQFSQAAKILDKVTMLDASNPDAYFFLAVTQLEGKKAFVNPMVKVREAMGHLQSATALDQRGVFYLFQAYLAYDFFERKLLNHEPSWSDLLGLAVSNGASVSDGDALKDTLQIKSFGFPVGEFD